MKTFLAGEDGTKYEVARLANYPTNHKLSGKSQNIGKSQPSPVNSEGQLHMYWKKVNQKYGWCKQFSSIIYCKKCVRALAILLPCRLTEQCWYIAATFMNIFRSTESIGQRVCDCLTACVSSIFQAVCIYCVTL